MSMVNSAPLTELCQRVGTRPRLAKSSSTRGITPGSASAWIEKQAARAASDRTAFAALGDINGILVGVRLAKVSGPILGSEDREPNSPGESAIEARMLHVRNATGRSLARQ